jgi:hypothetical protein
LEVFYALDKEEVRKLLNNWAKVEAAEVSRPVFDGAALDVVWWRVVDRSGHTGDLRTLMRHEKRRKSDGCRSKESGVGPRHDRRGGYRERGV